MVVFHVKDDMRINQFVHASVESDRTPFEVRQDRCADDIRDDEKRIVRILIADFAAIIVTQKLAVPLGSADNQIAFALLIHYTALAFLLIGGIARIDMRRLVLLCAFGASAILNQAAKDIGGFSVPSLALLLMISTVLIVVVPLHRQSYFQVLRAFVTFSVGASCLVFGDWLMQLVGLGMPNIETIIPKPWIYLEYVYVQPIQWDSAWLKPNGFFFLETSHVSQFVAMGLVIELAFFRRPMVIVTTMAALFLSYGGTGLVILLLSVPFLASRMRPSFLIGGAAILIVMLVVAGYVGLLEAFVDRSTEFTQPNSSAYNRFILPVERFVQHLQAEPERVLTGIGAGKMPKAVNNLSQLTFGLVWPPYAKMMIEYGLIAFLFWAVLFCFSCFGAGVPLIVAWVAFVQYQFLNGSLNVPLHTMYCWLLCAGYHIIDHENGEIARTAPHQYPASDARP